jgi:predicted NUDIX family NTP pyrophosphohydrolase
VGAAHSAGIILFRRAHDQYQVLLVRPGGPFWTKRRTGAWMIPKGMIESGEAPAETALREFEEELGTSLSCTPFHLCRVRQSGGKLVDAFAVEGDLDVRNIRSNMFELEHPRGSGRFQSFPEVEEARWFSPAEARAQMLPSQVPILDALEEKLRG